MSNQSRKFKKRVTQIILIPLVSLLSGGHSLAETCEARRSPATKLAQLANDPQFPMSASERENLQLAALNAEQREVTTPVAPAFLVEHDATEQMQELASNLEALEADVGEQETSEKQAKRTEKLGQINQLLGVLDQKVRTRFTEVETTLQVNNLPPVIKDRHREAKDNYVARVTDVLGALSAAQQGSSANDIRAGLRAAAKLLRSSTTKRLEQPFDPTILPLRPPAPVNTAPHAVDRNSLREIRTADAPSALVRVTKAITAPTAEDLAENEDVQITDDIRALATSLNNQPVAIYHWVRNNIEYLPTYGSIQGSQFTLTAKRGNAFDIASLFIALLRAANVPARYVTGTIEVSASTVMNWVGGAATPVVAQQLLGQGGVPNVGVLSGGTTTHIRIDHVWVEALIDYVPSRGAVHRTGDTWVPLDASFKTHTFIPPSDYRTAIPLDPVFSSTPLFTLDESLGKVTDVSNEAAAMDERFNTWATQVADYLIQKDSNTPLSGFIGGSSVIQKTSSVFSGTLPYTVLNRGPVYSTLPPTLRHTATVTGFVSVQGVRSSTPSFSVQLSLPKLNSRRLGITFPPATADDAAVLATARSSGASSLPVYLVNVVPSIRLDDSTLGAGAPLRMGSSLSVDVVTQGPPGSNKTTYQVVAGDEVVVGITGNGVTRDVLVKRLAAHPVNDAAEYLQQIQLHYWMEATIAGDITAKGLDVQTLIMPSVGIFVSSLTVASFFGTPVSGIYQARFMDIQQAQVGVAGPDRSKTIAFLKQTGMIGSFLEGTVFDQLEGPPPAEIRGISAVHVISEAMTLNIPVYRITLQNRAAVLPLLSIDAAVKSDINNAVLQGKTVIVPESNLPGHPWSGVGYIIQDETTGAGAYRISGGINGGQIVNCLGELIVIFVRGVLIVVALALLFYLLAALLGNFVPRPVPIPVAAVTAGSVAPLVSNSDVADTYSYFLVIVDLLALATVASGEVTGPLYSL